MLHDTQHTPQETGELNLNIHFIKKGARDEKKEKERLK